MYITNCTRPDIAYAVGRLSRYTSNPNNEHWEALIRVLRYLKYTMSYGIHLNVIVMLTGFLIVMNRNLLMVMCSL